MAVMYWDLTQWATRAYLFDEICGSDIGLAEDIRKRAIEACVPQGHHHHLADIMATIDGLDGVPEDVRNDMRAIYTVLAEAESSVHGNDVDHMHFHEVGEGSHIQSVLEICLAVRQLCPERIVSTPVQVGSGKIECEHGIMDVPAPATAAILARDIPIYEPRLDGERCTPTSAAVIFHYVDEFVV